MKGQPWVTYRLTGTLVGRLWGGGTATKPLDHCITTRTGRAGEAPLRVKLAEWVRQVTRDGDFDGPCVIEEAEVSVVREFPAPMGGTYTRRVRTRYYETLEAR